MPATGLHTNWSSVTLGGTAIKNVQSVGIDHRGSIIASSGDDDRYPTNKYHDFEDPAVTVRHRDLIFQNGKACGSTGALVATHRDADNVSGYTATMSSAILVTKSTSGEHRAYGEGTLSFEGVSADGATNPLAYAAVP
jgi:hypothetical protein